MVELCLIVILAISGVGAGLWAGISLKKAGKDAERSKKLGELVDALEAKNEVSLGNPVNGAADRLRKSKWNRDSSVLPDIHPDNDK